MEATVWKRELERVQKELMEEKKEQLVMDERIETVYHLLEEVDPEELQKKLRNAEKLHSEFSSGRIYERVADLEKSVKKLQNTQGEVLNQLKRVNPVLVQKLMYNEFSKMKEEMKRNENELFNSLGKVSGKIKSFVVESKARQKDELKDELLKYHADKINKVAKLESDLNKLAGMVEDMKEGVENSLMDLISRNKEEMTKLEQKFGNKLADIERAEHKVQEMELKIAGGLNGKKELEERVDALAKLHNDMDARLEAVKKDVEQNLTARNELERKVLEKIIKKTVRDLKFEERKELDRVEMEDIRLVDSRLRDMCAKIDRLGDFVIDQGQKIRDLQEEYSSELNNIKATLESYRSIEPVVIE